MERGPDAAEPLNAVCVCSDPEVSKKKTKNEDAGGFSTIDLALPASTDPAAVRRQLELIRAAKKPGLTVLFSTYQSIEVIAGVQQELLAGGFPAFDLIICDEAHRTTGVTLAGKDESAFVKVHDIVSMAMHTMLEKLQDENLADDSEKLQKFYDSVRKRADGIDNAEGNEIIINELYEKFFKTAFPKMAEQLGIVYTPRTAVNFIIHSVNDVLQNEFGRSLSDENVHILDPFTGTGTFITRLLRSGLIKKEDFYRKYRQKIHANEIVLLAYYIAAVNIENVWHDLSGETQYTPFDSICLTDTFQMFEDGGQQALKGFFQENSERIDRQKAAPLRVIIGNPPYSAGQKSANDNAQNRKYERLDRRIAETYAKETQASNKNSLYDSYFRAFRWSGDRLGPDGGLIAFISNSGWLDGSSADGFRKCLEKEFSSVYVFNLRGNARTSGERRRQESGNVFGIGSRTPVAITILVRNPAKKVEKAEIFYHDIGDYLTREQKLETLKTFRSVGSPQMPWQKIHPDSSGDWINKGHSFHCLVDSA